MATNRPDSSPWRAPSEPAGSGPGSLGGLFLLTLTAALPTLLVLCFLVLPALKDLKKGQEEAAQRLDRIEKVTSLTYFSRKPGGKSTLAEILNYLRYWTEEETKCLPQEVRECKAREEAAVKALQGLGKPALDALMDRVLARDEHAGAKYFRKALLDALAEIDPEKAAQAAEQILLSSGYSTQARIFAARKLLEIARDRGVQALRAAVKDNDHRTMPGYSVMLRTYLEETTDQARGEVMHQVLHRATLDLSTVQEVLQAVPWLDRKDPFLKKLCRDLTNLFFRRNLESFRAAVLARPLPLNLKRQIIRSLSQVLPPKTLKPFLEAALKITVEEGTRQEILKNLREKCR